ncbi:MAG TPA: hypothetical protein VKB88_20225 [Bryobacteraceae bacterium]|nr:hypothetical protein [Bryobacteraceae bacterium]
MPSFWVAPGLRFNDCVFSEPVRLAQWVPPACAGVAVVLLRDAEWAPKPFRPLCFGEFGNDARRPVEWGRWMQPAVGDLYISILPMPFSTSAERRALRHELVSAYNPVCQATGTPSADELARKLDDLETRQHEQNAQILALLSYFARLFEPQPLSARRPIGFRPQPVPLAAQNES